MYIGSKWAFSQPMSNPAVSDPAANKYGLIRTWNQFVTQNQAMIAQARQTQDTFSCGIWYLPNPGDQFWCDCSTCDLQPQDEANLYAIIDCLIANGYKLLYFLFAPGGDCWPDDWKDSSGNNIWIEAKYQRNWNYQLNVIRKIKKYIAGKAIQAMFDLSNEVVPLIGTAQIRVQYITKLWVNITEAFGQGPTNHVPDMTFSIIPDPDTFQNVLAVWSGNYPAFLDIHPYGNPTSAYGSWRNVHDITLGWIEMFHGTALQNTNLLIGETNCNFSGNARQFQTAYAMAQAQGWTGKMIGCIQWPESIGSDNVGDNQYDNWSLLTDAGQHQMILGSL